MDIKDRKFWTIVTHDPQWVVKEEASLKERFPFSPLQHSTILTSCTPLQMEKRLLLELYC